MKNLFFILVAISILTSCGNKLYTYRKTVKVKEPVATSHPKVYITVHEVKPPATKNSKPTSANYNLKVNQNTVYTASKPVEVLEAEKNIPATATASAMIR
jgi:hypothetical protein